MRQFNIQDVLRDEFDAMPSAPGAGAATAPVAIDASGSAEMFEGVPEMGEAIPIGTYHFRLEKYYEGANPVTDGEGSTKTIKQFNDGTLVPNQPWFQLVFVCQQEPETGRQFSDFCPWVEKTVREKAMQGDSVAQAVLKDRLWKAKSILAAAGYKPTGPFDLKKDVFDTHPEVKVQLGLQPNKVKDATGKYVPDGGMTNKALKYLPLARPA